MKDTSLILGCGRTRLRDRASSLSYHARMTDQLSETPAPDLLSPLTIRGVTFRNRIVMSPMCQYSAEEGLCNDWHLVHLGSRAVGGAALVMVEAHGAHGYLPHESLSPFSDQREDRYGGSLENRMRLLLRVAERLRGLMPGELPLLVRISATDWAEGGWDLEQSVELAKRLKAIGVDLIDVSSGATLPKLSIPVCPAYQVPIARRIRHEAGILTGAVGLITEPQQANEIIRNGDADLVFLARELLRDPYWVFRAQRELGVPAALPVQYGRAR